MLYMLCKAPQIRFRLDLARGSKADTFFRFFVNEFLFVWKKFLHFEEKCSNQKMNREYKFYCEAIRGVHRVLRHTQSHRAMKAKVFRKFIEFPSYRLSVRFGRQSHFTVSSLAERCEGSPEIDRSSAKHDAGDSMLFHVERFERVWFRRFAAEWRISCHASLSR